MSNQVFPTLPGLTWNVGRQPKFDTIVHGASTGYEVRIAKFSDPLWLFKLEYEFLRDGLAGQDELNSMLGFFCARQGSYDSFLLDLSKLTGYAKDATVTGQALTVDGNKYAPLVRSFGSPAWAETIYEVQATPTVKANGVTLTYDGANVAPASGHWSLWDASATRTYGGASYPGKVVQFGSTPAAPVTADFSWYYRVRFEKDSAELEAFMLQLYELQEIELITARDL